MKKKLYLIFALLFCCCSCGGGGMKEEALAKTQSGRLETVSYQKFYPNEAVSPSCIMIVRDNKTEKEYMIVINSSNSAVSVTQMQK